MELIVMQASVVLREQIGLWDPATFWLQTVPETTFPGLIIEAPHILIMFGSTCSCELATMNIIFALCDFAGCGPLSVA